MADDQSMTVRAAASKLLVEEHADVLREAVRVVLREVMEAEVSAAAGADWYERSDERGHVASDAEVWPIVARLRAFRGIDTLTALALPPHAPVPRLAAGGHDHASVCDRLRLPAGARPAPPGRHERSDRRACRRRRCGGAGHTDVVASPPEVSSTTGVSASSGAPGAYANEMRTRAPAATSIPAATGTIM
jgi:hypothetical protein